MWMTPGIISGVLTYIINSMAIPIPTQDDWIHSLHSNGVQDSDTFIPTFIVSTIGMTSGLSLGPELPLILTAGMIGSFLGRLCRQSLLQARVLNLTAASAAIGGMFGFPLAGGIFVMELPHRMGLQYFEALSPATIASIVAVLINRMVIKNDVTGMFQYPFLSESLPSYIFKDAIVYGLLGGALGILYTLSVKKIKKCVYHLRDGYGDHSTLTRINDTTPDEMIPIINFSSVSKMKPVETSRTKAYLYFYKLISHAPTKAALTSAILGSIVGAIGMILPHVMFWGEAQLQTMIDGTPLPIFGQGEDPTSDLVALVVALQISRQIIFYEKQRSRGDIQALPEALCEPGKEGKPLVMDYDGKLHALDESDCDYETVSEDDSDTHNTAINFTSLSQDDIEADFQAKQNSKISSTTRKSVKIFLNVDSNENSFEKLSTVSSDNSSSRKIMTNEKRTKLRREGGKVEAFNKLLNGSIQSSTNKKISSDDEREERAHRRTQSEPFVLEDINHRMDAMYLSSSFICSNNSWKKPVLKRVDSYGEIDQEQPSLMDQARRRAASVSKIDSVKRKS